MGGSPTARLPKKQRRALTQACPSTACVTALEGAGSRARSAARKGDLEAALSVFVLPGKYRERLRTMNRQERSNEEMRRRERVIHLFPNGESALHLAGRRLPEQNEIWPERRHLDRQKFPEWWMTRQPPHAGGHIVARG